MVHHASQYVGQDKAARTNEGALQKRNNPSLNISIILRAFYFLPFRCRSAKFRCASLIEEATGSKRSHVAEVMSQEKIGADIGNIQWDKSL